MSTPQKAKGLLLRFRTLRFESLLLCIGFGFLVFALTLGLRHWGAFEALELTVYDRLLQLELEPRSNDSVVLINETEADLQRFGHPLPDTVLAAAVQRMLDAGAAAVGVDKYRDIPVPLPEGCTAVWADLMAERCKTAGRHELDTLLRQNPNVIWIRLFGGQGATPVHGPAVLYTFPEGAAQLGLNDSTVDPDGVLRRGLLYMDIPPSCLDEGVALADCPEQRVDPGDFGYSLGLMLAMVKSGAPLGFDEQNRAVFGSTVIPPLDSADGAYRTIDDGGYQFMLGFPGWETGFVNYTLGQLLDGEVPAAALRDKVVILGATARSLKDEIEFPFPPQEKGKTFHYGVMVHAFIAAELLALAAGDGRPLGFLAERYEIAALALWSLLGALGGLWVRSVVRFGFFVATGWVVIFGGAYVALLNDLWAPSIAPALAWTLSAVLSSAVISGQERRERKQLMGMFSQHVSKDVAEALWRERDAYMEGGRPSPQRLTATVLFTDIRGFTAVSESMSATELMGWLNEYMDSMARTVLDNRGIINKYIGDAIMAVYGVPTPRRTEAEIAEDARNAVNTALAMEAELRQVNARNRERGLPKIAIRAGIFTGPLVAGSLGSAERMEYTVIGDTVNTASRLESLKGGRGEFSLTETDCRILISEPTYALLGEGFEVRRAGAISVQGKAAPMALYQVLPQENKR